MTIVYILLAVCILTNLICLYFVFKNKNEAKLADKDKKEIIDSFSQGIGIISQSLSEAQKTGNNATVEAIKLFQDNLTEKQNSLENRVLKLIDQLDRRMQEMRESNEQSIKRLQEDNSKHLDRMRETVDEKLSKTINERFEQTFDVLRKQLEEVHKSLGDMQTIASDVGSLTKMLSNVKTTGIFGEIQLGAILDQILTKEQYETNFVTADGHEPVEYAIKLPGQNENELVYMPIDSKFPYTIYSELQNAYENNLLDVVKQKREQLRNTVRGMAKDINTKYIYPPKTTNFAVMFLPVEGLYAEVAKMGLIEELQSKFNVTIAGPTTMSALLNSLQMGFRTLAIQKKSGEVWKILGAVRTEFDKFNDIVNKIQKDFDDTSKKFDALVGTRSRMIASKLKSVERLDSSQSKEILGLNEPMSDEE